MELNLIQVIKNKERKSLFFKNLNFGHRKKLKISFLDIGKKLKVSILDIGTEF